MNDLHAAAITTISFLSPFSLSLSLCVCVCERLENIFASDFNSSAN